MAERRDSLWLYKKHRGKNERMNKENRGKGDEREKQSEGVQYGDER